jgi:hypothetical protein
MTTDAGPVARIDWSLRAIKDDHRHAVRRTDALLGGIVWWACHLGGSYWLIPRMCEMGATWPVHLLTVAMVALIVRAGLSSVQLERAAKAEPESYGATRDVWLGWVGLSLSIFFGWVTVAEWVPVLFLDPCY